MRDEGSPSTCRYPVGTAVAIYAAIWILLAFVLPGFLEASSRARVARAKSEIRNLAVSLNTYRIEHHVYPPGQYHVGFISDAKELVPEHISVIPLAPNFYRPRLWERVLVLCRRICLIVGLGFAVLIVAVTRGKSVLRVAVLCIISAAVCLFVGDLSIGVLWVLIPLGATSLHGVVWLVGGLEAHRVYQEETPLGEILLASYLPALFASMTVALVAGGFYVGHESSKYPQTSYAYATDGETGWIMTSTGPDADYDMDLATPFIDSPEHKGKRLPETEVLLRELQPLEYDPTNGTASSGDVFRVGP